MFITILYIFEPHFDNLANSVDSEIQKYFVFLSEPTFRLPCKQCGSRSVTFVRSLLIRIYTICHAVFAMLMSVTCIHLLKIPSHVNFYLLNAYYPIFGTRTYNAYADKGIRSVF